MIYYNENRGNKDKKESVITDSVRTLIVTELKDGKEKRFSQITRAVAKKDNVVNRELKGLIVRGWVIKTSGGYKLDISREDVVNYIQKSAVAIPSDSEIKEVKFEFCREKLSHGRTVRIDHTDELSEILSCLPEEQKDFVMNLIDEPYDFEVGHRALMKETTADLFNKIQIHAILDKNVACMPQMNDQNYEDLVFLINRLLEDQVNKIYKIEIKKDKITAFKNHEKIRQQVYDKPFKLIISYTPKKD